MLLIKNQGDGKANLSPEEQQQFLKSCEVYIENLKKSGQLISAQPLIREGVILTKSEESIQESPFDAAKWIQVGYYHILANDLDEAIHIAKRNPEMTYVKGASIEVRPLKMVEQTTGFQYPTKN